MGDLLLSIGLITQEQLDKALAIQKATNDRLGSTLIKSGFISEKQLIEALEMQLGVEFIDLSRTKISPDMAQVLSKNIAKEYGVVPVSVSGDTLYLAMSDPLNFMALEAVKTATRKKVVPMIATNDATERAIVTLYGNEGASRAIEEMEREAGDVAKDVASQFSGRTQSAPTVRLVNSIIERAAVERASDIHLEPMENELRVRMRIDGVMRNILTVPKNLQASVISRLKVMGSMNIVERKIPQDGRTNIKIKNYDIDMRMSTLPTIYGEKFVIRLLDKNAGLLDKEKIGLTGDDLRKYLRLLQIPSGVVLIVGPTGSGKSSTMYTMIRELNTEKVNLVTLEDPVEYNISGINQVQINEKTGMTFASGLRSILRQDPDIIAVGEIRDGETAQIAMRAAITGHLVLSTIHTNDAVSTIDRLMDIGVEPYLISSAVRGIISQRLVRRICPNCRVEHEPTDEELDALGIKRDPANKFYKGHGCPMCFNTGYRGRIGVFEILTINKRLRLAISDRASREEIQGIVSDSDFVTLTDNCRSLVLNGITTIDEARRTINMMDV